MFRVFVGGDGGYDVVEVSYEMVVSSRQSAVVVLIGLELFRSICEMVVWFSKWC